MRSLLCNPALSYLICLSGGIRKDILLWVLICIFLITSEVKQLFYIHEQFALSVLSDASLYLLPIYILGGDCLHFSC